jgi:hypothetical protein
MPDQYLVSACDGISKVARLPVDVILRHSKSVGHASDTDTSVALEQLAVCFDSHLPHVISGVYR